MTEVAEMTKDELAEYAKTTFKKEIDMRKSLENLRAEVSKMTEQSTAENVETAKTHIKNTKTGLVFLWTQALQDHLGNDGKLCNSDGNY